MAAVRLEREEDLVAGNVHGALAGNILLDVDFNFYLGAFLCCSEFLLERVPPDVALLRGFGLSFAVL